MKLFHKQRETERKLLYNISYIVVDHVFLYIHMTLEEMFVH